MPISNYGVLKGRAVDAREGTGKNPHYQVRLVDDTTEHRIAVNVQSQDKSNVEFVVASQFRHPITDGLRELKAGFTPLPSRPGGLALDYIRANLFDRREMVPLPLSAPGPDNDLNEKVGHYVQRAMADEDAMVYAFGEPWGPEPRARDKIFGFLPGHGIHDIHMNQGNDRRFSKDDGVWQDGGLLFQFPTQDQWVAIFLRFQTQAWHTDDATGHTTTTPTSGPPSDGEIPPPQGPDDLPTADHPDGLVRIVAALVNDVRSPERETVTLLNPSSGDVDLSGWKLADKLKNKTPLSGTIAAGAVRVFPVAAPMALSNEGGIISLLNDQGLKVDGVSYTRRQARHPGWTVVFR